MQNRTLPVLVDMVGLLARKPRSKIELEELMGSNRDIIDKYMKALTDEGLVVRKGRGVRGDHFTYHWVRFD